jgi:hypothetical protein
MTDRVFTTQRGFIALEMAWGCAEEVGCLFVEEKNSPVESYFFVASLPQGKRGE